MPKSNTLRDNFAAWYFNQPGASLPRPTNFYISRHSSDPGLDGANELGATGGYERVGIPNDASIFSVTDNVITTTADIAWAAASADQAATSHGGIWDHPTSTDPSHFLAYGPITGGAVAVPSGSIARIPAGTGFTWTEL